MIGIRHGEKMYETLLTKEEAAKAIDMGNFYAVPADNRDLNYDKYFKEGDVKRATIEEFNSDNTTQPEPWKRLRPRLLHWSISRMS